MKKIYFPFLALIAGFVCAFITTGVHSLFFILLPMMAFTFGYFSSWRRGLLCGFLLFISYTFATALMWEVPYAFFGISQYIGAFITGGFSICLIGTLAPIVKRGIRKIGAIVVLSVLAVVVSWCVYISMPNYRYIYVVYIICQEDMELYLPVETTSNKLSTELLSTTHMVSGSYEADSYKTELVDTQYGQMWNIGIYGRLPDVNGTGRSSNWTRVSDDMQSWQRVSLLKSIQLKPNDNDIPVNTVESQRSIGLVTVSESRVVKEFTVPIKVRSDKEVDYQLMLTTSIDKTEGINFGYIKTESYSERIEYKGKTSNDWVSIPVKAFHMFNIRGLGD